MFLEKNPNGGQRKRIFKKRIIFIELIARSVVEFKANFLMLNIQISSSKIIDDTMKSIAWFLVIVRIECIFSHILYINWILLLKKFNYFFHQNFISISFSPQNKTYKIKSKLYNFKLKLILESLYLLFIDSRQYSSAQYLSYRLNNLFLVHF